MAPPNVTIRLTVGKADKMWQRIRPVIEAVQAGEPVEMKTLQKASIFADLMEKSMTKLRGYNCHSDDQRRGTE